MDGGNRQRMLELKQRALRCTRCRLAETRTQVVFGEGNPEAPLVIVGEGPGENEDRLGRPFVGRAGKLLDECLLEHGITRHHVWITNILKSRALESDGGRYRNRAPRQDEIAACKPILMEELAIIRPLVILCLGGPAASTIIHSGFRITQERARWFENTPYAPFAMATLHPAYVLRQYGGELDQSRQQLIEDIGRARTRVIEARAANVQGRIIEPEQPRPAGAETDLAGQDESAQMGLF
jgi:uracil-DNA glycosylase family 4